MTVFKILGHRWQFQGWAHVSGESDQQGGFDWWSWLHGQWFPIQNASRQGTGRCKSVWLQQPPSSQSGKCFTPQAGSHGDRWVCLCKTRLFCPEFYGGLSEGGKVCRQIFCLAHYELICWLAKGRWTWIMCYVKLWGIILMESTRHWCSMTSIVNTTSISISGLMSRLISTCHGGWRWSLALGSGMPMAIKTNAMYSMHQTLSPVLPESTARSWRPCGRPWTSYLYWWWDVNPPLKGMFGFSNEQL